MRLPTLPSLQQLSIRGRLVYLIATTTLLAFLSFILAFLLYQRTALQQDLVRSLQTQAAVASQAVAADLDFGTTFSGTQSLVNLSTNSHIQAVRIFNREGQPFATHTAPGHMRPLPVRAEPTHAPQFLDGMVELYLPVLQEGIFKGTLFLRSDTNEIQSRFWWSAKLMTLVSLALLGLVLLASSRLQKRISGPILALAETARRVSQEHDYGVRLAISEGGEFRTLAEAFNGMLTGIQQRDEQFRNLFEHMVSGFMLLEVVFDRHGNPVDHRLLQANSEFERSLGLKRSEEIGRTSADLSFKWPPEVAQGYYRVAMGGDPVRRERFNESLQRFYDIRVFSPRKGQFAMLFEDITERKKAEEALLDSRALTEAVVENVPHMIFLKEATDLKFILFNRAGEELLGFDRKDLLGKNNLDLFPPEQAAHFMAKDREVLDGELNILDIPEELIATAKKGQRVLHTRKVCIRGANGTTKYLLGISEDITERKQAEEQQRQLQAQLQQSQKMESLGTLAGGVAHDMNNVLGAILGLASAHIGSQPSGSPLHQALDTICKATERGGKMVKSLLSFARQSPAEENKLDMNAILREQVTLLERTTLAKVRLQIDLDAELRPILGDASALTHAFMNLCVNAVDAMPENGTLTLHTRNVDNDWIEVVVEDNGIGMPRSVLEKALDPFFTTKETGKGTGLGLSMVFSTVKAHRGQMAIESEPDKGTRVRLRFPACEKEAQVQVAEATEAVTTLTPQGTLKVLLVDDDELIQSSILAILEVLGHTVNPAPSGEEALAKLKAGFEPDLVILDMNMPGLGGIGTLPRLRGLRPEVPVLLATGRVDQAAVNLASAHPGVTLLSKPFGLRELQKQLENIGLG